MEVEYALRAKRNPIGVAVYQLQSKLPAELKGNLPTAKQLADVVRSVLPERNVSRGRSSIRGGWFSLSLAPGFSSVSGCEQNPAAALAASRPHGKAVETAGPRRDRPDTGLKPGANERTFIRAKDLLAEFWNLEKDAEKMLEELATT